MTTTKAIYLFAAIVPFGCVILAAIALAHWVYQRRAARQAAPVVAA